ncbi:hypothetical protein HJG60_011308 [Phyllostomus discolor]|uniref:Uncharacterized protein n=1 Tax=Phyllostomus discolor TaxID=89673 RepID=A0A833ZWL9_9CHIR|nr:hypothetical protein HJG60_011308 [Phyllostomus discolor]
MEVEQVPCSSLLLPNYPLLLPSKNLLSDRGIGNLGTSCSCRPYSPLHSPCSCKNLVPVLLSVSATLLPFQFSVILIPVQMMLPGSWLLSMLATLKDSIIFSIVLATTLVITLNLSLLMTQTLL